MIAALRLAFSGYDGSYAWANKMFYIISEIGFGMGFGEVRTRKLVQTLYKTYLGCPRDNF